MTQRLLSLNHKNYNKGNFYKATIHRPFTFFDRLENTDRNKQALKTNQLCPRKINVCISK